MATKKKSILSRDIKTPLDRLEFLRLLALGSEDIWAIYKESVEIVAETLRPRFESGELRDFTDKDDARLARQVLDTNKARRWIPPVWRVERACQRLFIRSPEAAVLVFRCAPPSSRVESWDYEADDSLRNAAGAAMARDVLKLARSRGWTPRQRARTPHGRAERVA